MIGIRKNSLQIFFLLFSFSFSLTFIPLTSLSKKNLNHSQKLKSKNKKIGSSFFSIKKLLKFSLFPMAFFSPGKSSSLTSVQEFEKIEKLNKRKNLRRKLNIFENDHRYTPSYLNYPSMAVGKLTYDSSDGLSYSCTASLIGRNYILTNGHCVFTSVKDENDQDVYRYLSEEWKETMLFKPALSSGFSLDQSSWKSIIFPKKYSLSQRDGYGQDWVIIKLEKALGDVYGWLGLSSRSYETGYEDFDEKVSLIGYSGDKYLQSPGEDDSCSLKGVVSLGSYFQVAHDCDSTKGSSGSGLFNYQVVANSNGETKFPYIVAIHHAEMVVSDETIPVNYSISTTNLACETKEAYNAYAWILEEEKGNNIVAEEFDNILVSQKGLKPPLPFTNETIFFQSEFGLIEKKLKPLNYNNLIIYGSVGFIGGFTTMFAFVLCARCCPVKKFESKESEIKPKCSGRKK